MNETLRTITKRRSIRRYDTRQLDEHTLQTIIEAGRCAPSGGNNQTTHLLVIQNTDVLEELRRKVEQEFCKMEITEGMYKSIQHSIAVSKKGNYHFYFDAPTLILTANKKGYGNAIADCSCVLENMMIAAVSLDVGTCWINQIRWLAENPVIVEMLGRLGLKEDEIVCGGLALGYLPEDMKYPAPLKHNGNPVTWVK